MRTFDQSMEEGGMRQKPRDDLVEKRHFEEEEKMTYYTRKEVAEYLKISIRTVDRRVKEGVLKCCRLGHGPKAPVRFSEQHVKDFLNEASGAAMRDRAKRVMDS